MPGQARPDHQHEARAGSARRQDRLGLDRPADRTALQRQGAPGIEAGSSLACCFSSALAASPTKGCERWVHDPHLQHLTGEAFFQHVFSHERSDLSHWRNRFGERLELLLAESLRVAHDAGALRTRDLKRITVDTTVQPKAITFPTDAKLLHAAIEGLRSSAS